MSDEPIGALAARRVADARAAVAGARATVALCREVPWVSPAADGFRAELDAEGQVLAVLLRALDALPGVTPVWRPPSVGALASSAACWGWGGRSVRVGAGGFVSVDPVALADAGARLASAAQALDGADGDLARVAGPWAAGPWTGSPWTSGTAAGPLAGGVSAGHRADGAPEADAALRQAAADVRRGPLAPGRSADRLRRLASTVRAVADEHAAREADVRGFLAGYAEAWWAAERVLLRDGPFAAWAGEASRDAVLDALSRVVEAASASGALEAGLGAVGRAAQGVSPMAASGPPVAAVASPMARVLALLARDGGLVPVVDPPQLPPPRGLAGLVRLVALSDDRAGPDGSAAAPKATFTVQRLDHADGTRSWVVAVPGTQSLGVLGDVPTDNLTNVELVSGVDDAMTSGVLAGMRAAGIAPDEPVVLVGHSQGGMVATAVAAAAAGAYRVAGVVTAGSPSVPRAVPARVPVVRFEHRQDAVPQLDGEPTGTGVTVVERTLGGERTVTSGVAHDVHTYVETARALDDELAAHRGAVPDAAAVTAALGREDTSATTLQYRVTRDAAAVPRGGGGW